MARTNIKAKSDPALTPEGAKAYPHMTAEQRLRRSVAACLLWEDEFYEEGESIAKRIAEAAEAVSVASLAALAVEARTKMNLRHVPLLLLAILAKRGRGSALVSETIGETIQRADELAEFLAIYAKCNGVQPNAVKKKLSAQVKKGLAKAFTKFDAYQLAKYDRAGAVRLRDALFLCHAKPRDEDQGKIWERLVKGELESPDTWEVALSGGADKKETFERLLREGKLGYLALLRNLRNMEQAGVDRALLSGAILARKGAHRVLPFRFIAAARHAPDCEPDLDRAMLASLAQLPKLPGKTVVIVDVSGSMGGTISGKSQMTRADAACALAAVLRELCEESAIYATAGDDGRRKHATGKVPARHGMALADAIWGMCAPLGGGGIFLKQVMEHVANLEKSADRVVVITDEADCGTGPGDEPAKANAFGKKNYLINVGSYANGIGYGKWVHIDGFSENVIRYIAEHEASQ